MLCKNIVKGALMAALVFSNVLVASAGTINLSDEFRKDWKKGTASIASLSQHSTDRITFEDEAMSVSINPIFSAQLVESRKDNPDSIIMKTPSLLGPELYRVGCFGVQIDITNKSNEVLVIDPNKSIISIGSYYGRPISYGIKHAEQQSAIQPPVVIGPKGRLQVTWSRGDYVPLKRDWGYPLDMCIGQNIFGLGSFIFAVEKGSDTKYVPMTYNMVFTEESVGQHGEYVD